MRGTSRPAILLLLAAAAHLWASAATACAEHGSGHADTTRQLAAMPDSDADGSSFVRRVMLDLTDPSNPVEHQDEPSFTVDAEPHRHLTSWGSKLRAARKHLRQAAKKKTTAKKPKVMKALTNRCGYQNTGNMTAVQARLQPHLDFLRSAEGQRSAAATTTTINVHFHQIGKYDGTGMHSQITVRNQMNVLNSAYGPSGFYFKLVFSELVFNTAWFPLVYPSGRVYLDMKHALHRGGASDLNLYSVPLNAGGTIGFSTDPWGYGIGVPGLDGVVIDANTLPYGSYGGYNLGNNAVHEVGHWMGLQHPFLGGCTEPNDNGIDDTAEQQYANFNCYPRGSALPNTCPNKPANQPLYDPVNNYMGYTYDACMWEFTAQQGVRMLASWNAYRAGYYTVMPENTPTSGVPIRNYSPTPAPTKAATNAPTKAPTTAPTAGRIVAPTVG